MDFVSYVRNQSEKLNSRDYVVHLWHELEENQREIDIIPNSVTDFNNHLPVLLEQFWEIALEKLNDAAAVDEIDQDLKIYLLVLIYQCITQSHESISYNCVIYASEVYLRLLVIPQKDDFYKSKLYRSVLSTLQTLVETAGSETVTTRLVYKLRTFLTTSKLKMADLEITLATLMQIIFIKSRTVFKNFDSSVESAPVSYEALLSLKILLEKEIIESRKFLIITYLFNGLRKHSSVHLTPHSFNVIQTNFRILFKSLHPKFKEDHYKTFLNAFIHIWKHPEFSFYGEAVAIMNSLKEKYYRNLIDVLNEMMMTSTPHKNLFKLSLAIICYPPKYSPEEKVKVTNEILFRNIQMNCISSRNEVSNSAVESLAEILISPDFQKEYVKGPMTKILNCPLQENVINAPTMLRGLQSLMNKKWTSRSKNKNLFVIVVSVMLLSEKDYPEIYREVLDLLTEEASPFDLKPFLSLLSETYLKMSEKDHRYSAFQILKIIFRMALHPMASSTEFVKYLYMAMVYPTVCKGVTTQSEKFIDPIISDDFNFTEFFQKCHTLGLIRNEHVTKLIGNLSSINESNMKLLCAIVHLTDYKELSIIADHIHDNFKVICNSADLNYLFYIYNKIFKNNGSAMRLHQNLKSNEIMTCFIKHHLLRQTFRWNCVANAFALLKSLEEFTDLNEDYSRLKEEYDQRLTLTLQNKSSFLPLFYYSQLVIFGKIIPDEENLQSVTDFLKLCSGAIHRRSPEFNPKMWIGCLLLYTNICIIRTNLVETCLDFLQDGLNCSVTAVKLASINMTFDLCNLTTHNFEDLIKYMFKQLVFGDEVFKKTCLLKIDRLIRDDYLKLELEQFLIFVSILGDRNFSLSDYLKQLLSENFLISNTSAIAKYFVPLIVHGNGYKKHPMYKISSNSCDLVEIMSKNILDRRKIYSLLISSLPIKARFNIVYVLAINILENMMKGIIKCDYGFWKMVKDSIFIFKLISVHSNEEDSGENYYKKVSGQIGKYIIQKTEYAEKRLYPEYQKEIVKATETLLKLLFFNDSDNIQKHLRIAVFDTIMHWTNFLLADLVHVVHVDRCKEIQNHYLKVDGFFKRNMQSLRYTEESFETGGDFSSLPVASTSSLFKVSEEFIPQFDNSI